MKEKQYKVVEVIKLSIMQAFVELSNANWTVIF